MTPRPAHMEGAPETVQAASGKARRGIPPSERIGQRFGRLVILEATATRAPCLAICDCGKTTRPALGSVIAGGTKSCGCLKSEPHCLTHGGSKSYLYEIYRNMVRRCTKPSDPAWSYYGGRGITVCSNWLSSFGAFRDDIGERPSITHTLDRSDNDGGYWCGHCDECGSLGRTLNVRWASKAEQSRNRRNSTWVTIGDRRMIVADWVRETGVSRRVIDRRLRAGVTGEALLAPYRGSKKEAA